MKTTLFLEDSLFGIYKYYCIQHLAKITNAIALVVITVGFVGSMDPESSQQLQMWFSEHFFEPKLAELIVTPIVSATVEQKWREKMSEKPHSSRLLR